MSGENYKEIKKQLILSLLGQRSSKEVNLIMGYRFNQVDRWINGTKKFRWNEFCDFCEALQIPLSDCLEEVFLFVRAKDHETLNFIFHLRRFFLEFSIDELAKKLNSHPSVLKRYIRGETYPDLETVLAWIDLKKNYLSQFILSLIGNQTISYFQNYFHKDIHKQQVELFAPLASAIEACFCLEEYQNSDHHDSLWVSKKVGCSVEFLESTIQYLLREGNLIWNSNHYKITYSSINTCGSEPSLISSMVRFWTERALQRFTVPSDQKPINRGSNLNFVAYRITPMSKESIRKVTDILSESYQRIVDAIENDENPKTEIRALLFHHFSTNDISDEFIGEEETFLKEISI